MPTHGSAVHLKVAYYRQNELQPGWQAQEGPLFHVSTPFWGIFVLSERNVPTDVWFRLTFRIELVEHNNKLDTCRVRFYFDGENVYDEEAEHNQRPSLGALRVLPAFIGYYEQNDGRFTRWFQGRLNSVAVFSGIVDPLSDDLSLSNAVINAPLDANNLVVQPQSIVRGNINFVTVPTTSSLSTTSTIVTATTVTSLSSSLPENSSQQIMSSTMTNETADSHDLSTITSHVTHMSLSDVVSSPNVTLSFFDRNFTLMIILLVFIALCVISLMAVFVVLLCQRADENPNMDRYSSAANSEMHSFVDNEALEDTSARLPSSLTYQSVAEIHKQRPVEYETAFPQQ